MKNVNNTKKYGKGKMLFDIFMTWITGGFWIIVVIIQFLRSKQYS